MVEGYRELLERFNKRRADILVLQAGRRLPTSAISEGAATNWGSSLAGPDLAAIGFVAQAFVWRL